MTLQIGLVGTDGIVLASDRQIAISEGSSFSRSRSTKFFASAEMACCWSGGDAAAYAGRFLSEVVWQNVANRPDQIRRCGDRAWELHFGGRVTPKQEAMPQKVLLAFNDGMLWQLEVFSTSSVSAILDRVVAGDLSTTAKHISENYSLAPTVKMEELVILASHVVMMGAKENPALIGGIEVAIIPKSKTPYFLTLEQEQQLQLISQSVDAQIGNLLRQPFDCERVVPPAVAPEQPD